MPPTHKNGRGRIFDSLKVLKFTFREGGIENMAIIPCSSGLTWFILVHKVG